MARRRRNKSPIRLLVGAIALFEASGFALIACQSQPINQEALILAAAMPALCWVSTLFFPRFFPVDRLLLALTNFLCGVGILILYSMLPDRGMRQAQFYALGLLVMMVCILLVRWIRSWHALCWLMIPAGIGLLLAPVLFGSWLNGAKNWVAVPWIGSFQPSEAVKLMLLVVLAHFLSARRTLGRMLPALLFVAGCLGMLLLQRDLGTALMYYLTALAMYFVSTSNLPLTMLGLGAGAGAAYGGYQLFGHVRVRVAMWRNPWSDAFDKGFQIIQALMAIGSGGLFGLGLGLGQPRVIPAYYTDFVFAVICEQFGIIFGLCIVLVYIALMVRGFSVALRARQSFYALLAFGCTVMLGTQTFVIVAGVIKMIPLTGITMPFISYGGTSLLSCMGLMGLLQGVSSRVKEDTEQDVAMAQATEEAL
ncbi:MAG: FtsW/RodA/SpoVE family cell cycle protein [Oscillospiraceae bacterium]|jgi:cell division protein FtsW (lipid II flippase)|nr:FtsW/RodA/SpoVE family cell cycle protein [Oscillospiraceae bacterium]